MRPRAPCAYNIRGYENDALGLPPAVVALRPALFEALKMRRCHPYAAPHTLYVRWGLRCSMRRNLRRAVYRRRITPLRRIRSAEVRRDWPMYRPIIGEI